jgi:hypothetical protein
MDINSKTTKAEMEAYIKELEERLAAAKKTDTEVSASNSVQTTVATTAPIINVTMPTSDVTLVYLSNSMGYIKTANTEIHMNVYGEEFTLSKSQFDEVAGKYRRWFERGILAVSYKNMDVAVAKGLPTDVDLALTKEKLNSVGSMSVNEIENLWNSITLNQKHCLAAHVKRKIIGGDPVYQDRAKIDLFNRLTNGAFRREQDEASGRYTYYQTDMA